MVTSPQETGLIKERPEDMTAGLAQGQDASLGEGGGGAAAAGTSEGPRVGRSIGAVDGKPSGAMVRMPR